MSDPNGGASTPAFPRPSLEAVQPASISPANAIPISNGRAAEASLDVPKHCEFCLVAEFDIDKGSTLSHQYPRPVPYDDHVIAELMLPDGAHARAEDWTIFFLKGPSDAGTSSIVRHTNGGDARGSRNDSQEEDDGSRGLIYVLNLVRTKHDNTVRRGAMVKALCIGTRHPFIQIFKPALQLALDDYFLSPDIDCLSRLYEALNAIDLSNMPHFSREEKLMLRAYDRPDLFEERFYSHHPRGRSSVPRNLEDTERPPSSLSASGKDSEPLTSPSQGRVGNDIGEASPSEISTAQMHPSTSGPRVMPRKASHTSLRQSFMRRPSVSALNATEKERRPSKGSISANPSPSPSPAPHSGYHAPTASTAFALTRLQDSHFFETILPYRDTPLPLRIPVAQFPEEVGEFSLIDFIQTFSSSLPAGPQHPHLHTNGSMTHPIILLFNALVTQKRVVFLGHNLPAGKVAAAVLAACALGSGSGTVFRGYAQRAFPYTNLTNLDELETVPGYIAGVTNPRFEDLNAWDVLCNLDSGKITISKSIEPAPPMLAKPRSTTRETFSLSSISSTGAGHGTPVGFDASSVRSDYESAAPSTAPSTSTKAGKVAPIEARADALDNLFMEDILASISANSSESYIRARFGDYAQNFARIVARHEEHFYGQTTIGPPSQPYLNGQLGSGVVYTDRETELKEVQVNAMRVEGWRATVGYQLYMADEMARQKQHTIRGFDLAHQIHRLKRARQLAHGESELIFETISRTVKSYSQVIELLALLPLYSGGLLPLGFGMFHPSFSTRTHAIDLFVTISQHPAGRLYVQALNVFQRLAFARAVQTRAARMEYTGFYPPGGAGRSQIDTSGRDSAAIQDAMASLRVDPGYPQESSAPGDQSLESIEADEELEEEDTSTTFVGAQSQQDTPHSQVRDGLPASADALPFRFPVSGATKNTEPAATANAIPTTTAALS